MFTFPLLLSSHFFPASFPRVLLSTHPFPRPYVEWQVLKLRHLFRSRDLGAVRIGSVDDYQVPNTAPDWEGKEKSV
jgi:hypothetical protein